MDNLEDSFRQIWAYLVFCTKNNITLNPTKLQFAEHEVKAFCYNINQKGICLTQDFTQAIRNFPKPTNLKGSKAFFGLVNQAKYMLKPEDRNPIATF